MVREFAPEVAGTLAESPQTLAYLREALAGVVARGTARKVFAGFPLDEVPVAGKTGTGEVFGRQATSWFASFAPADAPRYAVVMMISQGGTGAGTSGRSVRAIHEALFGVHDGGADPGRSVLAGGDVAEGLPTFGPTGFRWPRGPGPGVGPARGPGAGRRGRPVRASGGHHGGRPGVRRWGGAVTVPLPTRGPTGMPVAAAGSATPRTAPQPLRRWDWPLVLAAISLCLLGAALVWSATSARLTANGQWGGSSAARHLANLVIGLGLCWVVSRLGYRALRRYTPILYVGSSITGLLLVLSPVGSTINGAHSWIRLPAGFTIQPSEFAKVAIIVAVALVLADRSPTDVPDGRTVLRALVIAAVPAGLSCCSRTWAPCWSSAPSSRACWWSPGCPPGTCSPWRAPVPLPSRWPSRSG